MKRSTSPPLPTALWEGKGQKCFLWSPEDLLHKNISYTSIIFKNT
jgi:hypothetical protein